MRLRTPWQLIGDWIANQPTECEREFARRAMAHSLSIYNAQRQGESRTSTHFGGAPVLVVAMRQMVEGLQP